MSAVCAGAGLAAVLLWTACADPSLSARNLGTHDDLRFLEGLMVTDDLVTVAPDQHWGKHPLARHWSFRNSASLAVMLHRAPSEEISFWFLPDQDTTRFHFLALWDDRPLHDQPARPAPGGTSLKIPKDLLTPGLHRLTLKRVKHRDAVSDHALHDNGFRELGWSLGSERELLALADRDRLRFVADFIALGLAGSSKLQMSGCLFDGARSVAAKLVTDEPATVMFVTENASSAPATFTVSVGSETRSVAVAGESRGTLEIPIPGGGGRVSLAVEGSDDGLFLWGAPFLRRHEPPSTGPVVLVTLDTTRRDALSPYGGEATTSPYLAAFAREADVFDAAFATSPWTLPSHASIFTGLYPSHHGAGVSEDHLPARFETVAEVLRRRGYLTAGFAGGEMCSTRWGVGQGFSLYRNPDGFETRGDRLTDRALEFLERHHADPFFLFVNYFDPHALYEAPTPYQDRFGVEPLRASLDGEPVWGELAGGSIAAWRAVVSGEAANLSQGVDFLTAAYRAEVAFMDAEFGRLVDGLRRHGVYDSSLIVVVSDHGELLGEGGFFGHCCRLDPELVEVPLLVKWPGQRRSRRVAELVSQVDLFGTLLGSAEAPRVDGLPLIDGASDAHRVRRTVFLEEHESRIHPLHENMLISRHLFGLQQLTTREVVWDGGNDCSERLDEQWRAAPCSVSWQERMAQLREIAALPLGEITSGEAGVLSPDERAGLEALGYVRPEDEGSTATDQ
jgi:arylsulfatase A-like enzyme